MNNASPEITSAITVTQLNEYVKGLIDRDPALANLYVKGEISNFKNHYATGHFYFTLKDEGSLMRAVMFKSSAAKLTFEPENGMKVILHGRVSAFIRDGQYQFYADDMQPDGVGALYIAYEQLKRRLEAEGLFDASHKKPLPKIPKRVGIITSATGAAIRDMINVSGRRFPYAKIILYPSLVQGPDAPASLIAGLAYFNRTKSADVIIIGRGGGSIEDLWGFNDEGVARAVYASQIPVVSAVGHETDFTICDFVADKRAPTPSAAAEIALPETQELKAKIENLITRESAVIKHMIDRRREILSSLAASQALRNPMSFIDDKTMVTSSLYDRMCRAGTVAIGQSEAKMTAVAGRLSALNPMSVIARGYSAVYSAGGKIVKSVADVKTGDHITLRTSDGEVGADVTEIKRNAGKRKDK